MRLRIIPIQANLKTVKPIEEIAKIATFIYWGKKTQLYVGLAFIEET